MAVAACLPACGEREVPAVPPAPSFPLPPSLSLSLLDYDLLKWKFRHKEGAVGGWGVGTRNVCHNLANKVQIKFANKCMTSE